MHFTLKAGHLNKEGEVPLAGSVQERLLTGAARLGLLVAQLEAGEQRGDRGRRCVARARLPEAVARTGHSVQGGGGQQHLMHSNAEDSAKKHVFSKICNNVRNTNKHKICLCAIH